MEILKIFLQVDTALICLLLGVILGVVIDSKL